MKPLREYSIKTHRQEGCEFLFPAKTSQKLDKECTVRMLVGKDANRKLPAEVI